MKLDWILTKHAWLLLCFFSPLMMRVMKKSAVKHLKQWSSQHPQLLFAGTWTVWAPRTPWWSTRCWTSRTPAPTPAIPPPSCPMTCFLLIEVSWLLYYYHHYYHLYWRTKSRWNKEWSFVASQPELRWLRRVSGTLRPLQSQHREQHRHIVRQQHSPELFIQRDGEIMKLSSYCEKWRPCAQCTACTQCRSDGLLQTTCI